MPTGRETGSLTVEMRRCQPERDRVSTRGRKLIYRWEIGCLSEGDKGCLSEGDRLYKRERQGVYRREKEGV